MRNKDRERVDLGVWLQLFAFVEFGTWMESFLALLMSDRCCRRVDVLEEIWASEERG